MAIKKEGLRSGTKKERALLLRGDGECGNLPNPAGLPLVVDRSSLG
jgi:hypothetical protein